MEKQKRWQFFLILAVAALTIYNILPTVFYYSKPLKSPIDKEKSQTISIQIIERVNSLETESVNWLNSFCDLLNLKPLAINFDKTNAAFITLSFKNEEDAQKFRSYLPRAGALIPFVPAQLSLYHVGENTSSKNVVIQRQIPLHFEPTQVDSFFAFSFKKDKNGNPTGSYQALVADRVLELGTTLGGISENAEYLQAIAHHPNDPQIQELIVRVAQNILSFAKVFSENPSVAQRYYASFTQTDDNNRSNLAHSFLLALTELKAKTTSELLHLQEKHLEQKNNNEFLSTIDQQRFEFLKNREQILTSAELIVKREIQAFASGKSPLNSVALGKMIAAAPIKNSLQVISLEDHNPFISEIVIDWANEKLELRLHPDLLAYKEHTATHSSYLKDQIDQLIYNQIASASQQAGETIIPRPPQFEIELNQISDSKSFLTLKLSSIAEKQIQELKQNLQSNWQPKHLDFKAEAFPIITFDAFSNLPATQKKLGLVIYAPAVYKKTAPKGFRTNSIYVIARGVDKILQKEQNASTSAQNEQFLNDFRKLQDMLQQNGFFGYSGSSVALNSEYANDYIFEKQNYFQTTLKATREEFSTKGTKRYAVLEFSDLEQRVLTENKIDTRIHEDLLKWRDEYRAAQVDITGGKEYDVPAPTKNVLLNNLSLSLVKYFRGDDRKILHWGLDLSGGKTVQIELRDNNNRPVTNPNDINQGINELYKRVNNMGVSEVSIRQEGDFITLDFPGAQGLSAAELVKSSSMFFHIVNEQFSLNNTALADTVNRFLQEVWNEAVVTNKKSGEDINLIAWKHLYGDALDADAAEPRSVAAKALFEQGLRLESPIDRIASSDFNEQISKIAVLRGDSFTDWNGQTHPLIIVFRNFALEGSSLENVHASYDPSKGNFLSFNVQSSQTTSGGYKTNPRAILYAWTSQFAQEKVADTPREAFSQGKGWRMAVVLNGSIISHPNLQSALSDSAMITGSFSQREVNQLEADLKAGSLTFTPHILSERNVSPELGAKERTYGVVATFLALALVMTLMIVYYRFAGLVASIALVFNLLIMWATLQNLQATLTLAGLAGLILTLGMAVDANVLVFERIREEFSHSGRIASAVHIGYKKAFSAILDSNLTTIIAALILLHFDAGPIKAFAITLIIGIISSMFTALFVTRYFFAGWVQNAKNKTLNMMNLIKSANFNFLKYTKKATYFSCVVILVGACLVLAQRHKIVGMDFTGGYALTIDLTPKSNTDYRSAVEKALAAEGVTTQDVQIRELSPASTIRLFLSRNLDQPGRPFYGMPPETDNKDIGYSYENNPKIVWLVNVLEKADLKLTPQSLEKLEYNWSDVSGQMSDTMRWNAVLGLFLAVIGIMIYITARFEFKYAISATLCTIHDVVFTVATIGILAALGLPVQIDLITVAALLTIVGYSLNDTIIVFDRIREDTKLMRKHKFTEIINHALNVTLSRTVMTSGTTLMVLVPLIGLGGSTIFGFALVMAIGVIFGTLSSLFIAAPLMLYFHHREEKKTEIVATQRE
ncbi:MAG: protein translocase subunit SecD [Chlamydiota bacterium]